MTPRRLVLLTLVTLVACAPIALPEAPKRNRTQDALAACKGHPGLSWLDCYNRQK